MLYTITGTIAPSKLSPAYRLGLFFTAVVMLALPLIYVGLIVAVGYGVWWHLVSHAWLLSGVSDFFWRLVGYLGPGIAGLTVIFFMVKPILARPTEGMDPVPIWPAQEPVLFQFVSDVCRQVGAPSPDRIQVDCGVNASAGFASTPFGPGRPVLVLTIGLPLAGLTVQQFGGVLAHEFSHFAQNSGMRLTVIVRAINNWFARVVYGRDEWDVQLQEWTTQGGHGPMVAIMALAGLSVWGTRRVLSLLMLTGHAISCFMLRQMEYDADSYQTKLVGSRGFASTVERMRELTVGVRMGYDDVRAAWVRRTLPANLPAFLLERAARVPCEPPTSATDPAAEETTGIFDTHPCTADRIRAADRAGEPGVLQGEEPASRLFTNFEAVGAAATLHHYKHVLQLPMSEATLMDTASTLALIDRRNEDQRAVSTFFHDGLSVLRPIRIANPRADATDHALVTWAQARATMDSMRATISDQYRRYESLQRTRDLAVTALAFIESGYSKLVPQQFELTEATVAEAEGALARAVAQLEELEAILAAFESAVATRLGCIVTITPPTAPNSDESAPPGHELHAEAAQLIGPLAALADAWPHLMEMRHVTVVMRIVGPATAAYNENPQARSVALSRLEARLGKQWRAIRTTVEHVSAGDGSTRTLTETLGIDTDTCADPMRAGAVLERALTLRSDLVAKLAAVAVRVEQVTDVRLTARV